MSFRPFAFVLPVGLLALACSDRSASESRLPSVGDEYHGGEVVDVGNDPSSGCHAVTVEYAAAWSCTTAQREELNAGYRPPTEPSAPPAAGPEGFRLAVSDCETLANLRRPYVKHGQRETLYSSRFSILQDKCLRKTEVHYLDDGGNACTPSEPGPQMDSGVAGSGGATGGYAGGASDGDQGADEYSTTNTQVDGVDEADFVKNDGGHVYVLSTDGLHVIDAWPAEDAHEVAHVPLRGEPRRMFLAGDKLLVYSRLNAGTTQAPSAQGCTYGYDCRFTSEGGRTFVQVFDVSDPANPAVVRAYEASGGYVSSRRVGPSVYTVVHDYGVAAVPGVDLSLNADGPDALEQEYASKRKAADAAIDELPAAYFLPWVRETDGEGNVESELTSCDRALAAASAKGESFVSVLALDIGSPAVPSRTVVAGKAGYVYASAGALYLSSDGVDGTDDFGHTRCSPSEDFSTVHKFSLDGLDTRYVGSAKVAGHVLNQFSMDEHDGVLRVATSRGWVPDPDVSSGITTLGGSDGAFGVIGELSGLAPSEDIRSVRFDGTRAFVVTFKKTDPLFVIDLTSPASPSVLGELKIPGFSTYMHPLDANHLLAIGFDTDDHGSFAYFDGIQIQIFDVTTLSEPKLLHKAVIGTRGSGSEALLNHLAFNYFAPKSMLAIPMTICEGGDDGTYGDTLSFSGLMAFDVSLAEGVSEHGRMPFVEPSTANASGVSCGHWWTDATPNVKRSIFMDDYVIGISDTQLQVAKLDTMGDVLQSIPLAQ